MVTRGDSVSSPTLEANERLLGDVGAESVNSVFSPLGHTIHNMNKVFTQLAVHQCIEEAARALKRLRGLPRRRCKHSRSLGKERVSFPCGRWPVAGGRWPETRGRKPAGGRWPVAGGRWPAAGGRGPGAGGRGPGAGGRWPVAGGRWPVAGGRWPVAGGRWPVEGKSL